MTMKVERQHKEGTSRVIQQSRGGGRNIVDNRSCNLEQASLIASLQRSPYREPIAQNSPYQLKTAVIQCGFGDFFKGLVKYYGPAMASIIFGAVAGVTGAIVGGSDGAIEGATLGVRAGRMIGTQHSNKCMANDRRLRQEIRRNYNIDVSPDIGGPILEKINYVLSILPESSTKSNPKLKEINTEGVGNASLYDYEKETLGIHNPMNISDLLYSSLGKSLEVLRDIMDRGSGYDYNTKTDKKYGLKSKDRKIMAGVSDANSQELLLDWTIRHEIGHSVDKKLGWENTCSHESMFGAWRKYNKYYVFRKFANRDMYDMRNRKIWVQDKGNSSSFRSKLLLVFGDYLKDPDLEYYVRFKHIEGKMNCLKKNMELINMRDEKETRKEKQRWILNSFGEGKLLGEEEPEDRVYKLRRIDCFLALMKFIEGDELNNSCLLKFIKKNSLKKKLDKCKRSIEIAENQPWMFNDCCEKDLKVGACVYMRDGYGEWVSFLSSARMYAVSNYQFSAPCEWFAEAFAAYYNPVEGAESRLRLDPEVRAYFFNKVGPFHGKKDGSPDSAR